MVRQYFELQPQYDSHNSFYKKAFYVKSTDGKIIGLRSYGIDILEIVDGVLYRAFDKDSNISTTTMRHARDFIYQFYNSDEAFVKKVNKAFLLNLPKWGAGNENI